MIYDVAILGGGVSGCASAWFLARKGLRIVLVDKQPVNADKICTSSINPMSVHYLNRFGVMDALKEEMYINIRGFQTYSYDGTLFKGIYDHPYNYPNYGHTIPRYKMDLAFRNIIIQDPAIDYIEPFQVRSISKVLDGVIEIAGDQQTIKAKYVVDAMGRASIIAKEHNLFEPLDDHKRYAIISKFTGVKREVDLQTIGTNPDIGPGYYCVFPTSSDHAIVSIILPEHVWLKASKNPDEYLNGLMNNRDWPLNNWFINAKQEGGALSFGPLAFRSKSYTHDHVMMVGDTTGFYDPLTGEGITMAFISSELAADYIFRCCNGESWDNVSKQYTEELQKYKVEALEHSKQLQKLLKYPEAFNRFVYSLSKNQMAANWLACALGNVLPKGERSSDRMKEMMQ